MRRGSRSTPSCSTSTSPNQTGWDVLRHLREAHTAHRPAIVLSTALRPVQCRLDEFRPDAILLKPFPIVALVRLLERLLGSDEGVPLPTLDRVSPGRL